MFQVVKIWMMSKQWFWSSQTRLKGAKFYIEASGYKQKSHVFNLWVKLKVLFALTWLATKNCLWVATVTAILLAAESLAVDNIKLLAEIDQATRTQIADQLRLYAQLLTAIFSIYFATIGIILSTGRTTLRNDIIQLLTAEQIGSVYSGTLVFSSAFCIVATSLDSFGYEPGRLILVAASMLMIATTLTLFPLGQRLFNFFDLIPLIDGELLPAVARHIEGVSNRKSSNSVANHHSIETKRLLEQLAYIDELTKTDIGVREKNLLSITDSYSKLLIHYLRQKHRIAQSSYWFPRLNVHKQWFFAGDSATSMALNTGSQLFPEEVPSRNWFETEITQRLERHIELAFKTQNHDLALALLRRLSTRLAAYARDFHFDVGLSELRAIGKVLETAISQESASKGSSTKKMLVAISDAWAAIGSNFCLETMRRMITFEKNLQAFFERDEWTAKSMQDLPAVLQIDTKLIVDRIQFELTVEGRRLSRPKYLRQLVIQRLLRSYEKMFAGIVNFQQKDIPEFGAKLLKAKLPEAATQVVLGSLHNCWKMPRWFEEVSQLLERYYLFEHYTEKVYLLPRIDMDRMAGSYSEARDKSIDTLTSVELVNHVFSHKHDEELPDHFGQIYYEFAEECIRALDQNNAQKFGEVIRPFVMLALLASDSKFPDPQLEVDTEFRLHLISTVLQDLGSILGFAILYGEYHSNPNLPELALSPFFRIIETVEDKRSYLIRMLRLSNSNSFSWSASPRNMIRINWKLTFERRANEGGFGGQRSYSGGKTHSSGIVSAFLDSYADASHVFFALKVLPLVGDVDFELDHEIEGLLNRLNKKPDKK